MIRHMRHGSPPRLMALQSILSPNRRESLPTPSAGVRITQVHAERGLQYVAAPVFGRPDVAEAAKLNIVAAGEPSAIAQFAPPFQTLGEETRPLGRGAHRG